MAAERGVVSSPHNPTGPISHVVSLHVSALQSDFFLLEHQFDESPLFDRLVASGVPAMAEGASELPQGLGLGATLDRTTLMSTRHLVEV